MNVVLQAGTGVVARQIDLATWDEKAAVNEFDDAVGEVAGKVRAVIGRAVFAQAAGDEDFGVAVGQGELDVGVGFVVTQEDVEAGLALLDQVVFQSQRFVLVGNEDVIEVDSLAHQGAGFGVGLRGFKKIGTDAGAEIFGLADVDDLALGVLVEIYAGLGGKLADFSVKVHEKEASH